MANTIHNPHPGEILKHDFLEEIGMSQNALAMHLKVPANRIHAIIKGHRGISADTDLRLCKFFSLSEGYFLRLQNDYELMEIKNKHHIVVDIIPYKNTNVISEHRM
jgi:antitoxin HigA-1